MLMNQHSLATHVDSPMNLWTMFEGSLAAFVFFFFFFVGLQAGPIANLLSLTYLQKKAFTGVPLWEPVPLYAAFEGLKRDPQV